MDTSAEILFVDGVKKNKTGIWGKAVKDAAEILGMRVDLIQRLACMFVMRRFLSLKPLLKNNLHIS